MVLVVKNPPDAADTGDEGKFSSCLEQTVKAQRGGSIQLSQADSVIESRVILGDAALNSVSSVVSDSLRPHGLQHPGLPVHHPLPEFTQTHVHHVGDAIQPSHPLSSPSPPTVNLSQHWGLFQ